MEWNHDSSLALIDKYHRCRVLWDPKHSSYHLRPMKYDAWTDIAYTFNVDVKEIRKKMDCLLSSFRRERTKTLTKKTYRSRWFAFDRLSFLMEVKADTVDDSMDAIDKDLSDKDLSDKDLSDKDLSDKDLDQTNELLDNIKKETKRCHSYEDVDDTEECDIITPRTPSISLKKKEWNNASCLSLIHMYKTKPVLWDVKHQFYYSKVHKTKAWSAIADNFNLEIDDIRRKIYCLLASYRREKSKVKNGNGAYKSRWYAYNSFTFLQERFEPTDMSEGENNTDNISDTNDEEQNSIEKNNTLVNSLEFVDQDALLSDEEPEICIAPKKHKKSSTEDKGRRKTKACKVFNSSAENETSIDYEVFGKHIACKLRSFSAKTRAIVEYGISNMLYHGAVGTYDNDPSLAPEIPTIKISPPLVFHNTTAESFIGQSTSSATASSSNPTSSTSRRLRHRAIISTASEGIEDEESDPLV